MTSFFDFIFGSSVTNSNDCESTISGDLTANSMTETTIKQEEATDSAKITNSVESLTHSFELLYGTKNGLKNGTEAKNPNASMSRSDRRKLNRKQKKSANDALSETATISSDRSENTDNNLNLDSPRLTTPLSTVSKEKQKHKHFQKNSNARSIPSIFDPIEMHSLKEAGTEQFTNSDQSSNLALTEGNAPKTPVSKKQQKLQNFRLNRTWKNPNASQIPSLLSLNKYDVCEAVASSQSQNSNPSSNLNMTSGNFSKKRNQPPNLIKNSNLENPNGRLIPSIFDSVEDHFFEATALHTNLSKKYDKFNPKKKQGTKPPELLQNGNLANKRSQSFNHLNNQNFNPTNAQNFKNSNQNLNINSKQFIPVQNRPYNQTGFYDPNRQFYNNSNYYNCYPYNDYSNPANKQFNNSNREKGYKKFVKISQAETESLNAFKVYATNKYHYRNPNWKKKPATTNTDNATANTDSGAVDEMFKKNNKNMRARKLIANEIVSDMETGLKVLQLMSDEDCTQEEAVLKVIESKKIFQCPLCCSSFERKDIETMLSCNHECCVSCAKKHFTEQIRTKSLKSCVCFDCDEPKWLSNDLPASDETVMDYFGMLDIVFRRLLDTEVHNIFHNKLRDFTLNQDDSFKWCENCGYGYFIDKTSELQYIICDNCSFVSCINCSREWKSQHENISCEQFKQWQDDNNEQLHKNTMKSYIEENGIVCPKCKFQYILSRGGCMHFTCNQGCGHEFCYGCNKPFYKDSKQCRSSYCEKLGLHAHHPMNCLFYLRDKKPKKLEALLLNNNIEFLNVCKDVKKCPIPLQKEDNGVLYDEVCNDEVENENQAGLCSKHYTEYLVKIIFKNDLDCSSIMSENELEAAKKRLRKS